MTSLFGYRLQTHRSHTRMMNRRARVPFTLYCVGFRSVVSINFKTSRYLLVICDMTRNEDLSSIRNGNLRDMLLSELTTHAQYERSFSVGPHVW
jgi:hypothetical protein